MPTPERRRVALLVETSNAHAWVLLHGVQAHGHERDHWAWGVHLTEQVHDQQVLDVCRVRGIAVPDEVAVLG